MSHTALHQPYLVQHRFNQLLCSAVSVTAFRLQLSILLEQDPTFIPAWLEHIWLAERDGDAAMYRQLLAEVKPVVDDIFFNELTNDRVRCFWTETEVAALDCLLTLQRQVTKHPVERIKLWFLQKTLHDRVSVHTHTAQTDRYVRHIEDIDITALRQELEQLPSHWWNIDVERGYMIAHHRNTRAVVLRDLLTKQSAYAAHDGIHESVALPAAYRLPQVHEAVLQFAERHGLALGRVAVVALGPHKKVYRHYDDEAYLQGRKRYHLVVTAGATNTLSAGTETRHAHVGGIFYFDNKVMHRAENTSSKRRIHVIFDGYPRADII